MKKYIVIIVCVTACALACSSTQSGKAPNAKAIYNQYCKLCHGADGTLELNGAKDFRLSELDVEERVQVITNGRKLMTPFKEILSEEEIRAVAEYTVRLSEGDVK